MDNNKQKFSEKINIFYLQIFFAFAIFIGVALGLAYSKIIDNTFVYILIGFIIFIFAFFIILIHKNYESPLRALDLKIKKFAVGISTEEDLIEKNYANKYITYIYKFIITTIRNLGEIREEFLHGKEIKSEVYLAKEIQEKLLHKEIIEIPSLEIVARSLPAAEIGGDSYDVIQQGDNYYIYVGDATGHGVGAGFIMMMVNALISAYSKVSNNGNQILAYTNDIVKPRVKANLLMTLLLLRWNEKEKKIYMTGAGHEYLMIYKQSQKKCFRIKSGGIALGMARDIHKILKEKQISFEKGDIIVLYSDGITEAINTPKRTEQSIMFGEDRLVEAIEGAPEILGKGYKTAQGVFNNISIQLSKFMGYKFVQLDDITLATISYKPDNFDKNEDFSPEIKDDFITEWSWKK